MGWILKICPLLHRIVLKYSERGAKLLRNTPQAVILIIDNWL